MDLGRSPASKPRWGELDEDDADMDFFLPPKKVIGPDMNGMKVVIEYKYNDDRKKVKVTTTTHIRKIARARLTKRARECRDWPKFGDAEKEDASSHLTMISTEEIVLEGPRVPGSKVDDSKSARDPLAAMGKAGALFMVCRTCGKKGDHWTSKCPYKDLAQPAESFNKKLPTIAESLAGAMMTYPLPGGRHLVVPMGIPFDVT